MTTDLPPVPKTFVGSAILQLLAGAVALNAGTISLIWGCNLGYIGTGIWVGAIVVITSIIGILTAVYRDRAWVISYLALSAFCCLLAAVLASIEMAAWYEENNNCKAPVWSTLNTCDTQCIKVHQFNVGAGAVEVFASLASVALCIHSLLGYTTTPYKKMVKLNPNI